VGKTTRDWVHDSPSQGKGKGGTGCRLRTWKGCLVRNTIIAKGLFVKGIYKGDLVFADLSVGKKSSFI
jgi:hypothetical protein